MSNDFRIAISGKSGCGNSSVSGLLAERFGYRMVNYTFRSVAEERDLDFKEVCRLAEEDPQWDYLVDENQVAMALEGSSVLGSRLAIWMLKEADLKVFLTASEEVRSERIYHREGGILAQRRQETIRRDKQDTERYKHLYGIDNNDYGFADLVINTDRLDQYQVAQIIEVAAKLRGAEIQKR